MKIFKINIFVAVLCVLSATIITAQPDTVKSQVYKWKDVKINKDTGNGVNPIFRGSTTDLQNMQIYSESLRPGKLIPVMDSQTDNETLIIVKKGELNFKIKNEEKLLIPGSIALIFPGEEYSASNSGESDAVFYVLKYKSKAPIDVERGNEDGGSFMISWNDLEFHPHDKGGIRKYFERATAMLKRAEMHVTTLNAGIKSHEPHTHRAAEIVLMISGNTQMQIGESFYKGSDGDLYYLGSNVPHAIENVGKESCMYFAFQFE